jgi:hypothetical protein
VGLRLEEFESTTLDISVEADDEARIFEAECGFLRTIGGSMGGTTPLLAEEPDSRRRFAGLRNTDSSSSTIGAVVYGNGSSVSDCGNEIDGPTNGVEGTCISKS